MKLKTKDPKRIIANKNKILSPSYIKAVLKNWDLYLLILPVLAFYIIFCYVPMYGVQIAFKDFLPSMGITGSPWVGFKHFTRFFESFYFTRTITNTFLISIYSIVVDFIVPIILALALNEVYHKHYKKLVQTVTYAPYFLSTVVMVGMLFTILAPGGIVNNFITSLGFDNIKFMTEPKFFRHVYVWSGAWQNTGWGSIIYLAALSSIDPQLHEAAQIDGAGRFKRIWHINIPGIMPTMAIMLIMSLGGVLSVGFDKIFLMQNDLNKAASEVISTYVYRVGLIGAEYSFASAVGLFNSVINFIMLLCVNQISKKISGTGLW